MDPLTHLLATRQWVGRDHATLLAGIAPDILFYSTYPVWLLIRGELSATLHHGNSPDAPDWIVLPQHVTHSFVVLFLVAGFAQCIIGVWPRWMWAWMFHIVIDIPTHERGQWAPQLLWPLSSASFNGVSWIRVFLGKS